MRVVVPFAPGCLDDRVVPSILDQGFTPEVIECVNVVGHPDSYPMILQRLFFSGDDFCVIEHDVESRPGFLVSLKDCAELWCFYAYDFSISFEDAVHQPTVNSAPLGVDFAPLGHTRFRGGLGEEIRSTLEDDFFTATWVSRDTFISGALIAMGHQAHRHPGKAIHRHPYGPDAPQPKKHVWGPIFEQEGAS